MVYNIKYKNIFSFICIICLYYINLYILYLCETYMAVKLGIFNRGYLKFV